MWKCLLKSLLVIKEWITWSVVRVIQVHIGVDPIVGIIRSYKLSNSLLSMPHLAHFQVLYQVKVNGDLVFSSDYHAFCIKIGFTDIC